jgi:hypothetical protein
MSAELCRRIHCDPWRRLHVGYFSALLVSRFVADGKIVDPEKIPVALQHSGPPGSTLSLSHGLGERIAA